MLAILLPVVIFFIPSLRRRSLWASHHAVVSVAVGLIFVVGRAQSRQARPE